MAAARHSNRPPSGCSSVSEDDPLFRIGRGSVGAAAAVATAATGAAGAPGAGDPLDGDADAGAVTAAAAAIATAGLSGAAVEPAGTMSRAPELVLLPLPWSVVEVVVATVAAPPAVRSGELRAGDIDASIGPELGGSATSSSGHLPVR